MVTRMDKLSVFNPNEISVYDIERLIDNGTRFDIVDGLESDEYDSLEEGVIVTDG